MRAVEITEFGKPDVLRVGERPMPQTGPGEVLVKVGAAGVNPVDTYIRSGLYRPDLTLPYTPGLDAAPRRRSAPMKPCSWRRMSSVPLPIAASASRAISTKLCAPSGTLLHASGGETCAPASASWSDDTVAASPGVTLRRGDTLWMFYAGGYNNEPQQIGVATSRDGVTWTRFSTDAPTPVDTP